MMGKKKKGCITILLCLIIFGGYGCFDNTLTNAPVEAGDNIEDIHNEKNEMPIGGGM